MKKILSTLTGLILVFSLASCASPNLGTPDEKDPSSNGENSSSSTKSLGDTIVGEDYSITLNGARYSTTGILGSAPTYDKYLILDVTVENNASEELSLSTLLLMELQGSDSKRYDIAIFAEIDSPLDGSVPAQGQIRGEVAFDVMELDSYTFSYKNGLLADSVQFEVPATSIN
jgi:hypothetical protein